LKEALGFGDFVFRLPDRSEIGRARDLYELERVLETVSTEAVMYHASRNHFSMWLNARGMFALSAQVRPRTVTEFGDVEGLRRYLLDALRAELSQVEEGMIADFSSRQAGSDRQLVRLGKGSIGGKGRGIGFVNSVLVAHGLADRYERLSIHIPRTVVIGTDAFERFVEDLVMTPAELSRLGDAEIKRRFLAGALRPELVRDLEPSLADLEGPLAVRSSSLLEDSRFRPFAGVYATYMLPNNHAEPSVRFREVCQAIKAVYASTFIQSARSYLAGTPHSIEEEKMAIVVQEVVGARYGGRFYPHFSGVAQSHNFYPVGPQRAEDGIAIIALGLGHGVVSGGAALRFSPAMPEVLPQLASPREFIRSSQAQFWAIDLSKSAIDFSEPGHASLRRFDLKDAEADGTLALVGSVYSAADDALRDSLNQPGPRVATFNNVLKWRTIPLAESLRELLKLFRRGMGGDVEIEFAVDAVGGAARRPCLYVLQIRPMVSSFIDADLAAAEPPLGATVVCKTSRALGHGTMTLSDVVYVRGGDLDGTRTRDIARQVGEITATLRAEGAGFVLIGPGRWGSADPSLGIPVDWAQITGARLIIEMPWEGRAIEPSQGTHFFQNMTSLRIGYVTVRGTTADRGDDYIDVGWLDRLPARRETESVRHVRVDPPLRVRIDGRQGRASIWQETGNP
jgi:hypothetical protein